MHLPSYLYWNLQKISPPSAFTHPSTKRRLAQAWFSQFSAKTYPRNRRWQARVWRSVKVRCLVPHAASGRVFNLIYFPEFRPPASAGQRAIRKAQLHEPAGSNFTPLGCMGSGTLRSVARNAFGHRMLPRSTSSGCALSHLKPSALEDRIFDTYLPICIFFVWLYLPTLNSQANVPGWCVRSLLWGRWGFVLRNQAHAGKGFVQSDRIILYLFYHPISFLRVTFDLTRYVCNELWPIVTW